MAETPSALYIKCDYCGAVFNSGISANTSARIESTWFSCAFCRHWVRVTGVIADLAKEELCEGPPRTLKFSKADPDFELLDELISSVRTSQLWGPVGAFLSNMSRVQALLEMPIEATWLMRVVTLCNAQARLDATRTLDDPVDEQATDAVARRTAEIMKFWFSTKTPAQLTENVEQFQGTAFDGLLGLAGARMWLGLESVLVSQITSTWTAFEVLAGDLWEQALNVHPHKLADLAGKKHRGKDESTGLTVDEKRSLPLGSLQKYGYNLSRSMGTILRTKYRFTHLESARRAYWDAFDDESVCLNIDNKAVTTLAGLRHVFVHKGGVVVRWTPKIGR
jgi:hypothetical protein